MISLEGSNCLIFATVQLTSLLKLATNAYLEIKSKSFGWNWFSSYQLIVYIEREMTTLLCNECGKSFTDEPLLYIHQTRQPDKTSHSCGECSTEVIGKMALKNHKRKHKMPAVKNLERKHKARKGICLRGVPIYYNDKGLSEGPHKEDACCQRCGLDVCGGSLRKKTKDFREQ